MNDEIISAGMKRLSINAIKLAMIFEIADNNFINKFKIINNHEVELNFGIKNVYPITLSTISEACNEVDQYFMPMFKRVKNLIESGDTKNNQVKILSALKRHNGKMKRTELCRSAHLTKKEMADTLEALEFESEEIITKTEASDKTKPTTWVLLRT